MHRLVPLACLVLLTACPMYDSEPYVSSEDGLIDANQWASYGPEQAIAVAIGRQYGSDGAGKAAEYGNSFAAVDSVEVDSLSHRLVVHFASGWKAQVTPIKDGKAATETPGLP
jgi:hypothetical protein